MPFFCVSGRLAQLLESRAELESGTDAGRMFDEIFPRSAPFAALSEWRRTFPLEARGAEGKDRRCDRR